MPLTPFQRGVAQILAKHRNPESHIAGGAVINRGEAGVRVSDDLDIFDDLAARNRMMIVRSGTENAEMCLDPLPIRFKKDSPDAMASGGVRRVTAPRRSSTLRRSDPRACRNATKRTSS
jgi:hypothetical protein